MFQSNESPGDDGGDEPEHDHHPRHDAVSGDVPGAVPGRRDHRADARFNQTTLVDRARADQPSFTERITSSTSRSPRRSGSVACSVSPVFEMFNVNNSDAIISYQSTNVLSAQYLAPNTIMQPRMIGVGAKVRW